MIVRLFVPVLVVLPFVTSQKNPMAISSVGLVSLAGWMRKEDTKESKKSWNKIVRAIMTSTVKSSGVKKR